MTSSFAALEGGETGTEGAGRLQVEPGASERFGGIFPVVSSVPRFQRGNIGGLEIVDEIDDTVEGVVPTKDKASLGKVEGKAGSSEAIIFRGYNGL